MGEPTVSPPTRVVIVGRGRIGRALHSNLHGSAAFVVPDPVGRDADIASVTANADFVLLAVTDGAVAEVAAALPIDDERVVMHFAGSLTLEALMPHARRASLHPLAPMPDDPVLAAARLRGAWMAIAGDPAVAVIAEALDARTFAVAESDRARYHATATMAASHLAGLMGQVERNAEAVGVPLAAYLHLARATLDNIDALGPAAALSGPIVRRDWATLRRHLASLPPDDEAAYRALAEEAARLTGAELPTELSRGT